MLIGVARPAIADPAATAAVLHARALLAEDDGDTTMALDLLRKGHEADPKNELIAFDLARIALESSAPENRDLAPLIAMDVRFAASRRLKVYALLAAGRTNDAAAAIDAAHFDSAEESDLRELVSSVRPMALALSANLGAEHDSNVTLLPDSEGSGAAGDRMVFDATLGWRPNRVFELGFLGQLGRHFDDRAVLADYDYGVASLVASAIDVVGPLQLAADVSGTMVTTNLLSEVFSTDLSGRLDAQLAHVPLQPGVYGRASLRNFAAGTLEGDAFDRDAKVGIAGLVSSDTVGPWSYVLRAGVLKEDAQGYEYRQAGFEVNGYAHARYGALDIAAACGLTRRWYYDSTTDRIDTRVTPSLDVRYDFLRQLGVAIGYAYVHNGSSSDQFRYGRHIVRLTLGGSL